MTKNENIVVFKEVFDYYVDGDIDKDQFVEVLMLMYDTKWGNGIKEEEITDRDVRLIWKTLRHSVKKSVRNSKNYEDRKNKANNNDISSNTDFDNTNMPSEQENVLNGQEMGNINEVLIQYHIYPNTPAKESELKPISIKTGIPLDVLVLKQQELFKGYTESVIGKFSKVS